MKFRIRALKIEILFIFFVVDNKIMMNIYYSSEIVFTDVDFKKIMLNTKNVQNS